MNEEALAHGEAVAPKANKQNKEINHNMQHRKMSFIGLFVLC
jgi:hypothetical protein